MAGVLAKEAVTEQTKPFPAFMRWLAEVGALWELLPASGTGSQWGTKTAGKLAPQPTIASTEKLKAARRGLETPRDASSVARRATTLANVRRKVPAPRKLVVASPLVGGKARTCITGVATENKKSHCAIHKDAVDIYALMELSVRQVGKS